MKVNEVIALYARMRVALMVSVPLAMCGLAFWMTGEIALALLTGLTMLPLVCYVLPPTGEIRRALKGRKETSNTVWYMVEDRVTGERRIYK